MCPYAIYSNDGVLMCKPKKTVCIMCVFGSQKIFKEIENIKSKFYI